MRKTGLFTFMLIIAVSCLNEPDCYQLNNNTVVIFFKIIGGGDDAVQLISVQSPDTDSVFAASSSSKIVLPLNPKTEETLYTLQGTDVTNTLLFGYKRQVQFVSEACGERYYFQELNVLNHDFDSVRVTNAIPTPTPEPAGAKNVEIFRCATTNLLRIKFPAETPVEAITSDFVTIVLPPNALLEDFVLPLNVADSTTTYRFDFATSSKTLKVRYSRNQKEIAKVCGDQWFLYELHVNSMETDLTKVVVANDSIQDLPQINLEITP